MKRSDMIKIMVSNVPGYHGNVRESTKEVYMGMLLDAMEKAGILPPDNGTGYWVGTKYCEHSTDYSKMPIHKWDE
jgi:hypothetical protein